MTLDEGIKAFENAKEGEPVPVNPADVAYWLRALRYERQFLTAVKESAERMSDSANSVSVGLANTAESVRRYLAALRAVIDLERTEGSLQNQ